jgi:hypothetical protein
MNRYRVHALARDRDDNTVKDMIFDVSFAWGDWYPAFQRDHGHRWKLLEVYSAEPVHEVLT